MPFLIPVVAAIGSAIAAVTSTAVILGATTLAALGVAGGTALAIAGTVVAGVATLAVTAALSVVGSLFAPSPKLSFNPVTFKADTNAGLPYVIGRTGVGGNIVFADTSNDGHNKWLHYIVALSIGAVSSIDTFTANNVPVTFNASTGAAAQLGYNWRGVYSSSTAYNINDGVSFSGSIYICSATSPGGHDPSDSNYWLPAGTYAGPAWLSKMWQTQSLGAQPAAALLAPAGTGTIPEWTSVNQLSGIACAHWALQADQAAYPTGTPAPLWVLRGMPVYDPRLDSTYPGGSGAQRVASPSTWAFSENPYLHALQWCLGQTNNGKRTMGLGAPIGALDVPAFVTGANVADANGWKVGGQVSSLDSKWDILTAILQAGCGAPMKLGAKISCLCQTPRVSIATLTGADFRSAVSVQAMTAKKSRINRVIPTYRSEAHGWAMVPADAISVAAYVTADGGQRTRGFNLPLIQQLAQAAQWSRYAIEDSREFGPITGQLMPQWMGLQPGDCVTINEPEYGLNGQTVLIMDRKIDPATCASSITARSETYAKHAFALGQTTTPPPAPSLTGINLIAPAPNAPPWAALGTTVSTPSGEQTPAIIVTGTMENTAATNIVLRTRLTAGPGPWEHYDSPPASVAGRVVMTGFASAQTRDVGISYLVRGVQGLELVIPAVTTGTAAAVWSNVAGTPANLASLNGSEGINNSLVPTGVNRVPFSQFEGGAKGWAISGSPGVTGVTLYANTNAAGGPNLYTAAHAPSVGNEIDISSTAFFVTASETLTLQGFVGVGPNFNTQYYLQYYKANGSLLSNSAAITGTGLSGALCQETVIVPPLAVSARVLLSMEANVANATVTMGLSFPMVCGAVPGALVYPGFAAGPGYDPGATAGAIWGTNVAGIPTNLASLAGSEPILNSLIAPNGHNRVPYSQFEGGTKGWGISASGGVTGVTLGQNVSGGVPNLYTGATCPTVGNEIDIRSTAFLITPGETLALQGAVGVSANFSSYYYLQFDNAAGAFVANSTQISGSGALKEMILVPAGAVTASVLLSLVSNVANATVSMGFQLPMVSGAAAGSTGYPAFNAGPGYDPGATVGATWGANVSGIPANLSSLAGTEEVQNQLLANYLAAPSGITRIGGLGTLAAKEVIDFGLPDGTSGGALNKKTSKLTDDANLGGTATWNGVISRPSNLTALTGSESIQNQLIPVAGANRVPFSKFEKATYGWSIADNSAGLAISSFTTGVYNGLPYIQIAALSTAAGQYLSYRSSSFPVTAGEQLAVTAQCDTSAGWTGTMRVTFYDASGSLISNPTLFPTPNGTPAWTLYQAMVTVPAGAFSASGVYYVTSTASGQPASNTGLAQLMICGVPTGQVTFPAFNPGPNAVDAADVTAVSTARYIQSQGTLATRETVDLSLASGASGGAINKSLANIDSAANARVSTVGINTQLGVSYSQNPLYPLSSTATTTITVAACTIVTPAGTYAPPAASIGGLSAGTVYSVFYDLTAAAYVAVASGSTSSYAASVSRYLYIGTQSTQTAGGGYTSPPPPPSGGGRGAQP